MLTAGPPGPEVPQVVEAAKEYIDTPGRRGYIATKDANSWAPLP